MTISYSNNWHLASLNTKGLLEVDNEKRIIEKMILWSSDEYVRNCAASDVGAVYVIAGIHTSASDSRQHATVRMGINSYPWSSHAWPARTAHIYYAFYREILTKDPPQNFETQLFNGHGTMNNDGTIVF